MFFYILCAYFVSKTIPHFLNLCYSLIGFNYANRLKNNHVSAWKQAVT